MKKPTVIPVYESERENFMDLMREFVAIGFIWVNTMRKPEEGLLGHFVQLEKK